MKKNRIIDDFRNKKIDILVATPVVEVGIDIPSATVMLIEGADRFGLAQLHQLRGRVGRGDKQSYCLLFSSNNKQSIARLKNLETLHLGAQLAQVDLKLRGPGEMFGSLQHGFDTMRFANQALLTDIHKAKEWARQLLKNDPAMLQNPLLRSKLNLGTIDPN